MPQIFTIWLLPTPFQTLKPNLGNQLMNSKGLWRTRAVLQSQACLPGWAHVSSWGSPFKSRHWDESLCTSGFLRNSPRGKKKSSGRQRETGKERERSKANARFQAKPVSAGFCWEFVNCSVVSNSLQPHGLYPARLLCPWNSPDKETGVGCHFLLQGIFLPRDWTWISCTVGRFFTSWTTRKLRSRDYTTELGSTPSKRNGFPNSRTTPWWGGVEVETSRHSLLSGVQAKQTHYIKVRAPKTSHRCEDVRHLEGNTQDLKGGYQRPQNLNRKLRGGGAQPVQHQVLGSSLAGEVTERIQGGEASDYHNECAY